ncbi:hypothetical protein F511_45361 [Dorcoceras hygrometricum]|uniref:Uncharacterized protein n=1 Tax=Dorcoceras hygrometricum TaxID=472368 RepID=A0A2Z6ZW77_9LAMI|nr:hypothetical protein F511_45361 [Dorcoceras hygrometricum]
MDQMSSRVVSSEKRSEQKNQLRAESNSYQMRTEQNRLESPEISRSDQIRSRTTQIGSDTKSRSEQSKVEHNESIEQNS